MNQFFDEFSGRLELANAFVDLAPLEKFIPIFARKYPLAKALESAQKLPGLLVFPTQGESWRPSPKTPSQHLAYLNKMELSFDDLNLLNEGLGVLIENFSSHFSTAIMDNMRSDGLLEDVVILEAITQTKILGFPISDSWVHDFYEDFFAARSAAEMAQWKRKSPDFFILEAPFLTT